MRSFRADRPLVRALLTLSVAQIISWGTVGLTSIVGRQIAADLGMNISAVFAGTSVFYVAMGLLAPALGNALIRFGARRVMMAGTVPAGLGFLLLSAASGPAVYFAAWMLLGAAGGAAFTTAAYVMLNEVAGRQARNAIGALMLASGLSSSIFWPTTSLLAEAIGWRGTCVVYAGLMVLVCLPLYAFGLPRRGPALAPVPAAPIPEGENAAHSGTGPFLLIVLAIILNAFVTFGISAVLIELLMAEQVPRSAALAFGSALGVVQVGARAVDFIGGRRWDAIATALMAGVALPVSTLLLMVGQGAYWALAAFILLYGLSSGVLAVSRATIPLVFYDKDAFARATSRIALPLNLVSAASPPILVGILAQFGSSALLAVTTLSSMAALLALMLLSRRRPANPLTVPSAS